MSGGSGHAAFVKKLYGDLGVVPQGRIYTYPLLNPMGRGVSYEKWTNFDHDLFVINKLSAQYPGGEEPKTERVSIPPVPHQKDGSLGRFARRPPPYDKMDYDAFMAVTEAFYGECANVIDLWRIGSHLQPELAKSLLHLFPVVEGAPLMPLLRAVSPSFFAYLDETAAKAR